MRQLFRLWLVLISGTFSLSLVKAQNTSLWYFAIGNVTSDKQSIVAYTADGTVNTLIEGKIELRQRHEWRLAPDVMLGIYSIDGETGLYYFTSDSVQRINVSNFLNGNPLIADQWFLYGRSQSYVVLYNPILNFIGVPPLLINLNDLSVEPIEAETKFLSTFRFSANGRYLRFLEQGSIDGMQMCSGYELDLEQHTQRALFQEPTSVNVSLGSECAYTDDFGDYWVVYIQKDDLGFERIIRLISVSGDSEELVDPDELNYILFDNQLWSYPRRNCEEDCRLTRQSLLGIDSDDFVIPSRSPNATSIQILHQLDDDNVLIFDSGTYWWLGLNGRAETIGYWSEISMVGFPEDVISPDGRLLFVSTTPSDVTTSYRIWDSHTQQYILEHDTSNNDTVVRVAYRETGFILAEIENDQSTFWFYRYKDNRLIDLPPGFGTYFDTLPNGQLLYNGNVEDQKLQLGIYRYNPDEQAFEVILENAGNLPIPPTPSKPPSIVF